MKYNGIKGLLRATGALAAATALTLLPACGKKEKKAAEEQVPTIAVAVPIVDSVTLTKSYPATLTSNSWANVVGRASGTLLRRLYQDGQYVSKGQALMEIESTKYRDAVMQAEAALETAKSKFDYYSRQYAAMKKALEADAVSQMDVIQAEASMKQAQAAILDATADLSIARTNLGYCTVKAPISGYITSSDVNPGSFIDGSGETVLATIVDNSSFAAVFEIESETYERLLRIKDGLGNEAFRAVPLIFSTDLNHQYTANLNFEAPAVNKSTGTLQIKGDVKNDNNELKDGMFTTVRLPYGFDPQAILVKDAALGTNQLGRYLYVVNDSNKIVYTPVTVGDIYRDSLRVVEKGLQPGQRYVTKALLTVRAGMEVNPQLEK